VKFSRADNKGKVRTSCKCQPLRQGGENDFLLHEKKDRKKGLVGLIGTFSDTAPSLHTQVEASSQAFSNTGRTVSRYLPEWGRGGGGENGRAIGEKENDKRNKDVCTCTRERGFPEGRKRAGEPVLTKRYSTRKVLLKGRELNKPEAGISCRKKRRGKCTVKKPCGDYGRLEEKDLETRGPKVRNVEDSVAGH